MAKQKREILIDLELESRDFNKELGDVNKELKNNRKQIKDLSKDYDSNAEEIARLELANKKLAESKRDIIKESKLENNSLNGLRRRIIQLKKERDDLDTSIEGNAKRFNDLTLEIKETTEQVKGFEEAGGDFRRNVGNYTNSVEDAIASSGGFGDILLGVKEKIISLANPITGLIAGLGAVVSAYAQTGRGSRDLARATDRLNSAFLRLGNQAADIFGDNWIDNALRTLQTSFLGLASTLKTDVNVAIREQLRLFELTQLQADADAKRLLDLAERQRQIRDDERKSFDERIKANEQLLFFINEREENQIANVQERIRLLTDALKLDQGNVELQTQLKQAELELQDIREEASGFRSEQMANEMALSRELSEADLRILEAKLAGELAKIADGNIEKLKLELDLIEKRKALQIEAAGENQKAIDAIILESENERQAKFAEFREKEMQMQAAISKDLEGITTGDTDKDQAAQKTRLENIGEEMQSFIELYNMKQQLRREDDQAAKASAEYRKSLEMQIAFDTLNIIAGLVENKKASALIQIAADTGIALARALSNSQSPTLDNIATGGLAGVAKYVSLAGTIIANSARAVQIVKGEGQNIGGGSVGAVTSSTGTSGGGGGFNLAAFNQDNAGVGILGAAVAAQETQAQSQAQSVGNQVAANMPEIFVSLTEFDRAQENVNAKITEASLGG